MITKSKLWFTIFILISGIIFLFPFTPLAQTSIPCGQTMAGSISTVGEKDDYTFTASGNDKVTIRLVVTSGGMTPYLELYDSAMTKIRYNYSSSGNYTSIDKTLVTGGTYTIRVYDYGNDATGNYNLTWQRLNNPCNATSITCGQTISDSLSAAGEQDFHTFTATSGDKVTIRLIKTSGNMTPYLELYDSTGARIAYNYTSSGNYVYIDATLSAGGPCTIVVSDYGNDATGNYNLTWQRLNNPCNATSITCGVTAPGSLSTATEMDFYSFTATANDKVTIRLIRTSGNMDPCLELYDSTGTRVAYQSSTYYNNVRVDATLSTGGIYTVVVSDDGKDETGNYNLTWQRLNNPCNATSITCGQTISGSLSAAGEQDFYTFTATSGDKVTIRLIKTSGTMTPYLELYDSTGTRIDYDYISSGNYVYIDATLSAGGPCTLVVSDYGYDGTGNYNLTWQRLNNPCNATSIICGVTAPGSLSTATEMDFYSFTATANDKVTIRLIRTSGNMDPYLELYDSTGTRVAYQSSTYYNNVRVDATLSISGIYTVVVSDYGKDETGNYNLTWQRLNNPCNATSITCGVTAPGSLSTATEMDFYSFTATANDKVTIRLIRTSGNMDPYLELYDSTGTRVAYQSSTYYNNVRVDATLSIGGIYTVVVSDDGKDETGNYNLTWQRLNNPCNATALTCGQTASNSLSTVGELDFYTIMANPNDKVTIRLIRTSGTYKPQLDLYDSTGVKIASSYNYSGNDVMIDSNLSAGGTYTLCVSDYGNNAMGNYHLTWQRLNNPCNAAALTCGQPISSSLSAAGEQDFYAFTANAGDAVTIRVVGTSGDINPYIDLYDSMGTRIANNYSYSGNYINLDKVLTAGGNYVIVVSDYNNNGTGSYRITLERLNNPCNATSITCGQIISGSIGTVGEQVIYTFTEIAGSNIVLTLTKTSGGLDPSLELYGSTGARIAYVYTFSGSEITLSNTLSAGGTFVIIASDYGNNETGNYTLKFQKNNNSCTEVVITSPNGGEVIEAGSTFPITWTPKSGVGITSQEIRLSTDGGTTFPTVIATGLSGNVQVFNWSVSPGLKTTQARIRITVTDVTGISVSDDSNANFILLQNVSKVSRTYVYNQLNRLIQIRYEDGTRVAYTYDAVGNRITLTGVIDEIIGTWSSGIWYWNPATSLWTKMTSYVPTGPIAAGDVTGDGRADVISCWTSGLWYQNGATLGWTKVYSTAPSHVAVGDITGDGRAEIIGTWGIGIWYWNPATSLWTKMTSYVPSGPIAAGDVTGDGRADVVSVWPSGLWYQNGATLGWTNVYSVVPSQVAVGDITGDGRAEIIGTWSTGIWYWNPATSLWTKMTSYVPSGPIAAGDVTGDGRADVVSVWPSGLWYQDGATLGWTKVHSTAPSQVAVGDITGD